MTLRLLAVGDIHLGRSPGSVPAGVAPTSADLDALGPRAAWARTVEAALEQRVQAVLLLGDVVDDEEHFIEGWTALKEGVQRLLDAGIEVAAVAGNHDVRVLPRLARALDGLRLLGAGGRWEAVELSNGTARLVGWSYPTAHAGKDPTFDDTFEDLCRIDCAGPTIGLLHGDLDAAQSHYAWFTSARLATCGADAWLLGHVHKPSFSRGEAGRIPVGYLGSLTGLDPTETGLHGPWLLAFEGRNLVEARHIPLAPLRWERISIAVDAWSGPEDLEPGVTSALVAFEERERASFGSARAVGLRIDLVGRSRFHRELRAAIEAFDLERLHVPLQGRTFFVDQLVDTVRPEIDLAALAGESDPPGLLARRLLCLDAPASDEDAFAERARLLRLARTSRENLVRRKEFVALGSAEPKDDDLVDELRAAGLAALEELLESRPGSEARS
ncbi:MAG: metallophosphoesterase [Planctomycetota bacterium]|nr:metallophosphoesterase [Planctomycetota bacterium]